MTLRADKPATGNSSFVTPGESYRILASSADLRTHMSDSYWCTVMEQVCEGRLEGIAVRYTGDNLVFLQFRPNLVSPAGYRYPLFLSIPIEFLVPTAKSTVVFEPKELKGSFGSVQSVSSVSNDGKTTVSDFPKLCVVCGRYNMPSMINRPHGWKCKACKGKKSVPRLREEAQKLQNVLADKA